MTSLPVMNLSSNARLWLLAGGALQSNYSTAPAAAAAGRHALKQAPGTTAAAAGASKAVPESETEAEKCAQVSGAAGFSSKGLGTISELPPATAAPPGPAGGGNRPRGLSPKYEEFAAVDLDGPQAHTAAGAAAGEGGDFTAEEVDVLADKSIYSYQWVGRLVHEFRQGQHQGGGAYGDVWSGSGFLDGTPGIVAVIQKVVSLDKQDEETKQQLLRILYRVLQLWMAFNRAAPGAAAIVYGGVYIPERLAEIGIRHELAEVRYWMEPSGEDAMSLHDHMGAGQSVTSELLVYVDQYCWLETEVMHFCTCGTKRLPWHRVRARMRNILRVILLLHDSNIVHRDVKSRNLLLLTPDEHEFLQDLVSWGVANDHVYAVAVHTQYLNHNCCNSQRRQAFTCAFGIIFLLPGLCE